MKVQPTRLAIKKFSPFVRIIVYCLKIIGLAPFSVETPTLIMSSRQTRMKTFRFSKFGLAYNLLITSLCPVFTMLSSRSWSSRVFLQNNTPIIQSTIIIRSIYRSFVVSVITSCWAFRQRRAVRIMNEISEVDVEIARLRKQPSNRRSLIFLTVHVIINAFVWISFYITNIASLLVFHNFAVPISNIGALNIMYWFIVEYFFIVGRIARDLETVNKNLLNLKGSRKRYVSHSPFVDEFLQAFSTQTQSSQLAALRSLIGTRAKLSELAQDVEDFFSFPILVFCGYNFIALVFDLYRFVVKLLRLNNDTSHHSLFHFIILIFMEIYPLISLSVNVTRTESQAKLTAKIVRQLLAKPLGLEIEAELQKFSLQLILEDFRFTANGFFPLNYTFLHSMLAASTTYLVILLQFQTSD